MGYAGPMRFESADLALLADTEEIEIETAAPDGPARRTIIWVVVDGDDAFIRSYRGSGARWYREAVGQSAVKIHVAGRELAATVVPATDPSSVRRTSEALARKYEGFDGTPAMLEPSTFDTTLRLVPN
jgi:hypothetical protein